MNGFEATRYIRNQMNSQIPIIALTADVTTVDLEKCKVVGMNDYISKPVDDRLLYRKIIDLLKKPAPLATNRSKCVDLTLLKKRTKTNRKLLMEMIEIYLEQTPSLVSYMKQSLYSKDWDSLQSAAHKMIPSFSIMGIHNDFENMAKKVQEYTRTRQHLDEVKELVMQIDDVCSQACIELEEEYKVIKKTE
jgi:CheY-like chemotaxis protein